MFFGWYVVGGGFLAQMLVVGFFTYAVSLLVVPVRAEFGATEYCNRTPRKRGLLLC